MVFVSPQTEPILGIQIEDWYKGYEHWYEFVHPDDRDPALDHATESTENLDEYEAEFRWVKPSGEVIWIQDRIRVFRDESGAVSFTQGLIFDITDRKEAQLLVEHMAFHDPLTELPNRRLFEDYLDVALARAGRGETAVGVLFLDLNRFKLLNDTRGHDVGDELLKEVAARLRETTRDADIVARQGGDEFLVMLPDLPAGPDAYGLAAGTAQRLATALSAPYELTDGVFDSSASIGISIFPMDARSGSDLLRNADEAMYACKRSDPRVPFVTFSAAGGRGP